MAGDLLDAFKGEAAGIHGEIRTAGGVEIEMEEQGDETDERIREFSTEFSSVSSRIEDVKEKTKELEHLYDERKRCSKPKMLSESDPAGYPQQILRKKKEINEERVAISESLQNLKKIQDETLRVQNEQPAQARMQGNQIFMLTGKFKQALEYYMQVVSGGDRSIEDTDRRRGEDTGVGGEQMLMQQRRVGEAAVQHANVQQRLAAEDGLHIARIVNDTEEIVNILKDQQVLLEQQGELINDVRVNVETSVDYVVKGRSEVQAANRYQRQASSRKCYMLICVLVVVVIGVVVVGVQV